MLLAWLGFRALATTSSGLAATLGRRDGSVTRQAVEPATEHAAERCEELRSAGRNSARLTWRRSTLSWWRSTAISMSLVGSLRRLASSMPTSRRVLR